MPDNNFTSDGFNGQYKCCYPQCSYLTKSPNCSGGWCRHPNNRVPPMKGWPDGFTPSVTATGGCYNHSKYEMPY